MSENWASDFMAMCCGLSLAVALGWNVTAGAAEWRHLAEDLCIAIPSGTTAVADRMCQSTASRTADQPTYLALLTP